MIKWPKFQNNYRIKIKGKRTVSLGRKETQKSCPVYKVVFYHLHGWTISHTLLRVNDRSVVYIRSERCDVSYNNSMKKRFCKGVPA
jgi:hypothetical protein